ncbi:MAG TPA: hypothetical protein VF046_10610 [Gemmatimonadales bacterium]
MSRRISGPERQARIKWEFASLYPGIVAGEWMPAWLLAEKMVELAHSQGGDPNHRVCDPAHCEFRGGGPRPPEFRELRTRALDRRSDAGS